MINIAVADDQSLFRNMLIYILEQEPTFNVVGGASDGNEMLELCKAQNNPDIILLDVKMPNMDGISCLNKIKSLYPEIKVIILTTFEEDEYIYKAFSNNADGYIVKDTKPKVLVNIVKCVNDGLFVMHSSVREFLFQNISNSINNIAYSISDDNVDFDTIDLMIIKLISLGKNNAEIAAQINYSEGTVKNRLSRMLSVTGTKDRTQLAIFAIQNGLV